MWGPAGDIASFTSKYLARRGNEVDLTSTHGFYNSSCWIYWTWITGILVSNPDPPAVRGSWRSCGPQRRGEPGPPSREKEESPEEEGPLMGEQND